MWRKFIKFWYNRLTSDTMGFFRGAMKFGLRFLSIFIPVRPKTMLFTAFGGKRFDDSPRALYEEVCNRPEFADWTLIWSFREPENFQIPRGKKVEMYTPAYYYAVLSSRVRVSNSQERSTYFTPKGVLRVETGHGCGPKKDQQYKGPIDHTTIWCAAGEFNVDVFSRNFRVAKECFLRCGLPRNDAMFRYTQTDIAAIRERLNIPSGKKVILYMPTWRNYTRDDEQNIRCAPPIDLKKWEDRLGNDYVLLFRAHQMVTVALNLTETAFIRDVSKYPALVDLYMISDLMISDYSSAFIDYSILERPIFCFAYDLERYEREVGLEWPLEGTLPCPIDQDEDSLLEHIQNMDIKACSQRTHEFRRRFAPYEQGHAAKSVVDEILRRLHEDKTKPQKGDTLPYEKDR